MRQYDQGNRDDKIRRTKERRALIWRMEEEEREREELQKIQAKFSLEIGASDDPQEQHADAVAKTVVAGGDASSLLKNQPSTETSVQSKEAPDLLMSKDENGSLTGTDQLQSTLNSSKGSGQSLDATTQQDLGRKMGADLSDVKIHTDAKAHEMSEGINAKAFTHGQDIYFRQGNFNTSSTEGKELLAHELTHTQQQKGGLGRKIQRQPPGKTDKDPHEAAFLNSGGNIYQQEEENSAIVFTADQEYACQIWGYSADETWCYIQLDHDHKIYGYAKTESLHKERVMRRISVTDEKVIPDSISQLATFYNVRLGAEPFRVDVTYNVFIREGKTSSQYLVFNFYYQGTGFVNWTPAKILISLNEGPLADVFKAHEGDFSKDFNAKTPQKNLSMSSREIRKRGDSWMSEYISMLMNNKADISFGENGTLANKTTTYTSFRVNALQLDGSYAKNMAMWVIIYDDKEAGAFFTPAESIHALNAKIFVDKDASPVKKAGEDAFDKPKNPYNSFGGDRVKRWLNSRPKAVTMPGDIAESSYAGQKFDGSIHLTVIPDGAIRKDQEKALLNPGKVSSPVNGFEHGENILFDQKQELALAKARLEIIKSNDLLNIKKSKINQVINHLEKLYNSNEPAASGDDYHSLATDASLRIDEITQLVWPGKGTDDDAAISIQKKSNEVIDAYIDALHASIGNTKKGRTQYTAAERKRISLKDRIAAMVVAGNSTTETTFIGARTIFRNIENIGPTFMETFRYMKYGILQDESYKLSRTKAGLFEENEKQDLSPYDYNREFGYDQAMQSYFEVSMFAQLSQVYFAYEMVKLTLDLEDKVWDILESNSVDKPFLNSKFSALNNIMEAINAAFEVDPYGADDYKKVDFSKVIAKVNEGLAIVEESGFLEKVQRIYATLQNDYETQAIIVFVIVLIAAFILTALGQVGFAALGIETAVGAGAAGFFMFEVGVFGATGLMGKKLMGEDITAMTVVEEFGAALLMVGFLRVAGAGFSRFYKLKTGRIEPPKLYTAGTTIISLQAYAELAHLVTEGEFMSGDERMKSLLVNFVAMAGFSIMSKYTVDPLENTVLKWRVNKYLSADPNVVKAKADLEAFKSLVMPKRDVYIDRKTGKVINTETPDPEVVKLMAELNSLEQSYLLAVRKAASEKKAEELPVREKKKLLEEVDRLKLELDNAVRDTQMMFAMAGMAMPLNSTAGIEFYPLRPGEIGYKESAKKYLEDRFGKKNLKETMPGSGVYLATVKDSPQLIFVSEKATEQRMLAGDEKAREGYELYKKNNKLDGVFETLENLNSRPFESLKDFFVEYYRKQTKWKLKESDPDYQELLGKAGGKENLSKLVELTETKEDLQNALSSASAEYLVEFENAKITEGTKREGESKETYDLEEHPDLVIAIMKEETSFDPIYEEIGYIQELNAEGLTQYTVEILGVTSYQGRPALISKKAAGSLKPFSYDPATTKLLNKKSVQDIEAIKNILIFKEIYIRDLQVLINPDGSVKIFDVLGITKGNPEIIKSNIDFLNGLIIESVTNEINIKRPALQGEIITPATIRDLAGAPLDATTVDVVLYELEMTKIIEKTNAGYVLKQ